MRRRAFLAGSVAIGSLLVGRPARALSRSNTITASLRGTLDATEFGLQPGSREDQSRAFSKLLNDADGEEIFLPAGRYFLSNIALPRETRIRGVEGATTIVFTGGGSFLTARDTSSVHVEGITFDGSDQKLDDDVKGLLDFRRIASVVISNCVFQDISSSAIHLETVAGRIEGNTITAVSDYGIYSVEARGIRIRDNNLSNCANGGILVHRWEQARDGSIITGNRIAHIGARNGGTGQFGNGINLYRADDVIVTGNHITDCTFSAIRANSASNALISGNQCLRSGETAIYVEFAFQGAIVTSNIVDGAAIGISIANLNDGGRLAVCNGNVVRNLVTTGPYEPYEAMGFGIGIAVEGETTISGNVIEDAPRCGVLLGWGPYLRNVVATGNIIRKTPEGFAVSVVDGVGSVLIADNILNETARAVVGYRWRDAVTDDLAAETAETFPHLQLRGNLIN